MLHEVADGVWVRRSEWVSSNTTVVRADDGLILVDPGIAGADLEDLADDVDALGIPVVAGFSTHPHWDHLLWHPRFGDVPRYGTAVNAGIAASARDRGRQMAAESAPGIPLDLLGIITPLPADGGPLPGELIVHDAHAPGHAAVLLADRRVLLAGDMLSDVLVPMFGMAGADGAGEYAAALDLLADAATGMDAVIPGHGTVATGGEIAPRIEVDRAYVAAVQRGEQPADERWGPRA
ncbi:MBL fold metallo-hydrolase [Pseudolysinimonas kribbensis]|uniref:MBL fold metallo-hydrolase n=1 Tax=Pseudolysinimonas kribbensis TaxID=433641 RepID=UPI0031CE8E3B